MAQMAQAGQMGQMGQMGQRGASPVPQRGASPVPSGRIGSTVPAMGMTRRGLVGLVALGLLLGGTAACSDEDDGDGGDAGGTTTTTSTDGGQQESTTTAADGGEDDGEDGGEDGGEDDEVTAANDAVIQEYCDAVEANNAALDATSASPEDEAAQDALEAASLRLGEASDAVSPLIETFTPEQQAQFEECTDALDG